MTPKASIPKTEPTPRERLKALKREERVDFGARFYVRRKSATDFALVDLQNKERARFGDLNEILEDLAYALNNGSLPPPSGGRW